MGIFSKSEQSPSDVRKEYDSQINHFLRGVDGSGLNFFRRRDPLDNLLSWGEKIFNDRQQLERQLTLQVEKYSKAEGKIDKLKKDLETTRSELLRVSTENRNMKMTHAGELKSINEAHVQNTDDLRGTYESRITADKQKYDRDVINMEANHTVEINKLVGQLLINQKDNLGWADDKLKRRFQELQRLIESVTAPRNKEFLIPTNRELTPHMDPTNFLGRVGREKSHFLLKSAIWSIIHEQYFSTAFGFGALGPEAQRELMEVYAAWRRLFDGHPVTDHEDFAVFRQDKLANNWRSATFQCIDAVLPASDHDKTPANSPIARLSASNVNQTIRRIVGILSEVSSLSNVPIRAEIQDEIHEMAKLGRDIALQFGIHPAQLRLLVPSHGEQIEIGESFHDCRDGDSNTGSIYVVDLVTAPGLQKIGDGRSDLNSSRTLAPCEIFADQAGS